MSFHLLLFHYRLARYIIVQKELTTNHLGSILRLLIPKHLPTLLHLL